MLSLISKKKKKNQLKTPGESFDVFGVGRSRDEKSKNTDNTYENQMVITKGSAAYQIRWGHSQKKYYLE